ncbi:MAG: 4-alpha-glucanotransferase [Nocardioidaceae bacterium]
MFICVNLWLKNSFSFKKQIMNFPRASGILLHPTSLPSNYGIGDLGAEAYKFVRFSGKCAKQTYWQVLPLGPTGLRRFALSMFFGVCGQYEFDFA